MRKRNRILKLFSMSFVLLFLIGLLPTKYVFAAASAAPATPQISHNQWGNDVDGNYDITMNMYYGNNGTSYTLYERIGLVGDFKSVATGKLNDNTPSAQSAVINIRDRVTPGKYYYYVELSNSFGKSNSSTISLTVGQGFESKILIEGVDTTNNKSQVTVSQGVTEFKLINVDSTTPNYTVVSSNTSSVKASIVNGTTLRIEGLSAGRSGLKIVDTSTNDIRNVGIRVKNADGTLPGMPNYLSLGQVSEDTTNDLNFWKDTSNTDTNKRVDVRYIYINGGPINGWRTWTSNDGDRAKNYIKESLKLGIIPFFVYYNIPDNQEDYATDLKHINDKTYMEAYYKDLKFLLDICVEYGGDDTIGLIFEPDFLGYMMQNSGLNPDQISAVVDAAYSSGVLTKGKDPDFANNITGLVSSINYVVNKYYPQAYNGWQFNTWAYAKDVPSQGLMHQTEKLGYEKGREFIKNAAVETANYYLNAGITSYNAEFISIDKYGLDGAFEDGAVNNPEASRWFWNADIWNNYLLYSKTLGDTCKKPVVLWQIPVGHVNSTQEPNPYNGGKFKDLDNSVAHYEDSAPTFFFGDTFKPGTQARLDYFSKNASNDPKIKVTGDTVTWGSHMEDAKNAGIISILFGAGVNASTDAVGSPPTEDYYWITKAQRYYKNPVSLNGSTVTPPPIIYPSKGSISVDKATNTGDYSVTASIPSNSNGESYNIYENNIVIKTGVVTSTTATISLPFSKKPVGSYTYRIDITNKNGTTKGDELKVTVNSTTPPPLPLPTKATITVDNANNSGSYNVSISIPQGSNATSYKIYENGTVIETGAVTSSSQVIKKTFANKTSGNYVYKVDLINSTGSTSSDSLTVTVTQAPPPSGEAWTSYKQYKVGDKVVYNGVTYTCIQGHTSLPGWEPSNVASLWKKA